MTDIRKHMNLFDSDHSLHNRLIEWSKQLDDYEIKLGSLSKFNGGIRSFIKGDSFDRKLQIEGLIKIGRSAIKRMETYPEDASQEGLPDKIGELFVVLDKIFSEAQ